MRTDDCIRFGQFELNDFYIMSRHADKCIYIYIYYRIYTYTHIYICISNNMTPYESLAARAMMLGLKSCNDRLLRSIILPKPNFFELELCP